MKRIVMQVAAAALAGQLAFAGGYNTNTNQNAAFLRQPAQNAVIGIGGAYFNPAGVAFLDEGWRVSFNAQNVHQSRTIQSSYAPFALGARNAGGAEKRFKGTSYVPVLPSLDLAYVRGPWSGSFHFGVVAGGGKAKFPEGLGSFEGQIAAIPAVLNRLAGDPAFGYDADIRMIGEQYTFAGQLNLAYRLGEHLSLSAGLRANYIRNHYDASISQIQLSYRGSLAPAAQTLSAVLPALLGGMGLSPSPEMLASLGGLFADRQLDCEQSAWAFNPILGVDYRLGRLNLAARYEFNTAVRLQNKTAEGKDAGLPQYADGKSGMAADISALLALGAEYALLDGLRLDVNANYYFDKQGKVYNPLTDRNDKADLIGGNTWECSAGVEWDVLAPLTLSCGTQYSHYNWGADKAFLSDQSFVVSSCSLGGGLRYRFNARLSVDASIFNTFYRHETKEMADYDHIGASTAASLAPLSLAVPALGSALSAGQLAVPGSDRFHRTSLVIGLGVNYKF